MICALISARKKLNLVKNICAFLRRIIYMLKTKDANQLKFEAFKSPFEIKMDRNNRWVILSEILPWEELIEIYSKGMSDFGRPDIYYKIKQKSIRIIRDTAKWKEPWKKN